MGENGKGGWTGWMDGLSISTFSVKSTEVRSCLTALGALSKQALPSHRPSSDMLCVIPVLVLVPVSLTTHSPPVPCPSPSGLQITYPVITLALHPISP